MKLIDDAFPTPILWLAALVLIGYVVTDAIHAVGNARVRQACFEAAKTNHTLDCDKPKEPTRAGLGKYETNGQGQYTYSEAEK